MGQKITHIDSDLWDIIEGQVNAGKNRFQIVKYVEQDKELKKIYSIPKSELNKAIGSSIDLRGRFIKNMGNI